MWIVQPKYGFECQGEVFAKGTSKKKAIENFKEDFSYELEDPDTYGGKVMTIENDYICFDGEPEYLLTRI